MIAWKGWMGSPLPPISISDAVSGCETACCVSKLTIISSERATQNLAAVIDMHAAALRCERVRTGSVLHFELPFTFNICIRSSHFSSRFYVCTTFFFVANGSIRDATLSTCNNNCKAVGSRNNHCDCLPHPFILVWNEK